MRYVLIKKAAELTGYSVAAIESKIAKGQWVDGIHFIKAPDNRVFMDLEELERWITKGYKSGANRSASTSVSKGSVAGRL